MPALRPIFSSYECFVAAFEAFKNQLLMMATNPFNGNCLKKLYATNKNKRISFYTKRRFYKAWYRSTTVQHYLGECGELLIVAKSSNQLEQASTFSNAAL